MTGAGTPGALRLADGTTVARRGCSWRWAAARAPAGSASTPPGSRSTTGVSSSSTRTCAPPTRRIWAAGDLTGHPQFTHVAGVHGQPAASNAVLGLRRPRRPRPVPRVTFTAPEVGRRSGLRHRPGRRRPRALASRRGRPGRGGGAHGRLLPARRRPAGGGSSGATVVGPRAGEMLAELALAITPGAAAPATSAGLTHRVPDMGRRAVERRDRRCPRAARPHPAPARALACWRRRRRWTRTAVASSRRSRSRAQRSARYPATTRWAALSPTSAAQTAAIWGAHARQHQPQRVHEHRLGALGEAAEEAQRPPVVPTPRPSVRRSS